MVNPQVNPQGLLAQIDPNNPLVQQALGQPAAPTAQDTAGPSAMTNPKEMTPQDVMANPSGYPVPQKPMGASIGEILGSKGRTLPTVSSPMVKSITSNAGAALEQHPEIAAVPGGIMRTIVGGALQALTGVAANLGDASAGAAAGGGSRGAATGVFGTLAAHNDRIAKANQQQFENQRNIDKDRVMMAEANIRMRHEQRLIHNMDEAAIDESIKNGASQMDAMDASGQVYNKLQTHVLAQDVTKLIGHELDPSKQTLIPDGKKVVGYDKETGAPISAATYTITDVPDKITLDPENSKMKSAIQLLDEYNPRDKGPDGKAQSWANASPTGVQFNHMMQVANDAVASSLAFDRAAVAAGFAKDELKRGKEALAFKNDPNIINALAHAKTTDGVPDIMAARNELLRRSSDPNDSLYGKYNNIDNDMREAMPYKIGAKGEKTYSYDKILEDYEKKQTEAFDEVKDLQKEVDKSHGEDAAGLSAAIQSKINNPSTPQAQIPRLQRMKTQADASAKASLDYESKKKAQDQNVADALDREDLPVLTDAAINYQLDPNKLYTMRKGLNAAFKAEMLRKDPNWSEAKYKQRFTLQQELADDKPTALGGQVRSFNQFGGHLAQANRAIQGLNNTRSPWVNSVVNKIKSGAVGYEEAAGFMIDAEAVKDEYLNLLKNGHTAFTQEEERLAGLINRDRTPAEMQSTFRQMAHVIAVKAKAENERYNTIMGGGQIPGLISPDTDRILRQFIGNDDVNAISKPNQLTSHSSPIDNKPQTSNLPKNLPPAPANTTYLLYNGQWAPVPNNMVDAAIAKGASR